MRNVATTFKNTHLNGNSNVAIRNPSLYDPIMPEQVDAPVSNSNNDTDDNEHCYQPRRSGLIIIWMGRKDSSSKRSWNVTNMWLFGTKRN
jgi:hypothetical protein